MPASIWCAFLAAHSAKASTAKLSTAKQEELARLAKPIKSVKEKWKLLPAFLKVSFSKEAVQAIWNAAVQG